MIGPQIFDDWPERYDRWFETPTGRLINHYESQLLREFLQPDKGELILDAGCGTGIFTREVLQSGASVIGLDISLTMLQRSIEKAGKLPFCCLQGDMLRLPFPDGVFDKSLSVTAIEFIADAAAAVTELFRVTKLGGLIVVATLNSLSPWATRRTQDAKTKGHPIFERVYFRSPAEMLACAPVAGKFATAIHFSKQDDPSQAAIIEAEGKRLNATTGAFLIVSWKKEAPHPGASSGA